MTPWSIRAAARIGLVLGLVLAVGGVAGAAAPATSQGALGALEGTYRNEAPDGGRATIEAATRAALEDARRIVRFFAKTRILDNNPAFDQLAIRRRGREVEVAYGDVRTYRAPLGGTPVKQRSPDGHEVAVSYALHGSTLVERAEADKGYAVTTYRVEGGELVMATTIESSHLPEPVRFVLRFRREGEPHQRAPSAVPSSR